MAKMRMKAKTLFRSVRSGFAPAGAYRKQRRTRGEVPQRQCGRQAHFVATWRARTEPHGGDMGCHCVNAAQGDIQTIEEMRVASFRKMLGAGSALDAGLGWASQTEPEIGRARGRERGWQDGEI